MKRSISVLISSLVIFSMFISFSPISGQTATYSISGRVTDGSGNGVEGVNIFAERVSDFQVFLPLILKSYGESQSSLASEIRYYYPSAVTDANGYYSIDFLSGTYRLRAEMEGVDFSPSAREINSSSTESQDFEVLILEPVITDNTEVLTDESNQYLDPTQSDGTIFTFSQTTTELDALDIGDIMVSGVSENAPDGYLRKVKEIYYSGGSVIITTEPATLEEAIQDGSVFIQEKLSPDQVTSMSALTGVTMLPSSERAPLTFYFQIEDVVLYDDDGDLSTKFDQIRANGFIEFDMEFIFYLSMQNFQVRRFSLVNENAIRNSLEIVSEEWLDSQKAEYILSTQVFSPITLMAGPVPIVFVPKLDLVVGVDGSVGWYMSTEVSEELSMQAGIQYYYSSGWSTIAGFDYAFKFTPPSLSQFEMSLKGYFGPRFNLYLYGVAGPYVNITPYLEIKVEPLISPWWTLYGGIDVPVGFRVIDQLAKVLDLDDYEVVAIGVKQIIAQAETIPIYP
ncbi:MAG: carboxypeptidase-like regulatory domain-containing protein [Brevefilum sp.]|nr:carboxypeptidase-like regulatory domain-containing protein [Brevefilum sp.]